MRSALLLCAALTLISATSSKEMRTLRFDKPIDAISFGMNSDDIDLSVFVDGEWQELEIEKEFDPFLRESNLVVFSEAVRAVLVRGDLDGATPHPIRVSHEPLRYAVAARGNVSVPDILSRVEWGADETFLFEGEGNVRSDEPGETGGSDTPVTPSEVPQRVKDCEEWQRKYPQEFRVDRTETRDAGDRAYRWTRRYSSEVELLVVHHTAMKVTGDDRPPVERVRALYAYHANNRGWGDIGYHYLIDETGQIYEGKSGGNYVVGGHAYCSNVGTVGIALLGSFDVEKPSPEQLNALQHLLSSLATTYNLDLSERTTFHGRSLERIVRHRDINSTECPGYYVSGAFSQIRRNVVSGNLDAEVVLPSPIVKTYKDRTSERRDKRLPSAVQTEGPGLRAIGETLLAVRPGGEVTAQVEFRAGTAAMSNRARIGDVRRSNNRIGIWQSLGGSDIRVRDELLLPQALKAGESIVIRLRFKTPEQSGNYTIDIGSLTFTLQAEGRRTRQPMTEPSRQSIDTELLLNRPTPGSRRKPNEGSTTSYQLPATSSPIIRIRLTSRDNGVSSCEAIDLDLLRTLYRGTTHCEVIEGKPAVINTVSLEDYLRGLAEEPDSEPLEKQKAFAIAARSYAAHYLDPDNRKFPGMPYDGDDSAARFQLYRGIEFEVRNRAWVDAVNATTGLVLTKDGDTVKAAYFSSDDGRTRSPAENGWGNFPYAEIFTSKPDPWCAGFPMAGHGVGMSGCGAEGQANEGKGYEEILKYYYPGAEVKEYSK